MGQIFLCQKKLINLEFSLRTPTLNDKTETQLTLTAITSGFLPLLFSSSSQLKPIVTWVHWYNLLSLKTQVHENTTSWKIFSCFIFKPYIFDHESLWQSDFIISIWIHITYHKLELEISLFNSFERSCISFSQNVQMGKTYYEVFCCCNGFPSVLILGKNEKEI